MLIEADEETPDQIAPELLSKQCLCFSMKDEIEVFNSSGILSSLMSCYNWQKKQLNDHTVNSPNCEKGAPTFQKDKSLNSKREWNSPLK